MSNPNASASAVIEFRARALSVGPIRSLFQDLGAKALQLVGTHGGGLSSGDKKAIELYFEARDQVAGTVEGVVNTAGTHAANDESYKIAA